MNRGMMTTGLLLFATMACAIDAERAQAWRQVITGLWFFVVMFVGAGVLVGLRVRDGRLGLSPEEVKARARKRMPYVVLILVMAITPLLLN